MGCSQIRIWNRTVDKARGLAQAFDLEVVEKLEDLLLPQPQTTSTDDCIFYIVSTIPASAQESLQTDIETMLSKCSAGGVVVEMAYKPRVTPLIKAVRSLENSGLSPSSNCSWTVVEGIEALIEQGFEQFTRWTGMKPPKQKMRAAVLDEGQDR
jgi:pentafunctional AROM polypeptide